NRFERPPQQINQSKQALSNMLRQRHPLNTFIPGMQNNPNSAPQNTNYGQMQRSFPRQSIRQPHPGSIQPNQGMFPQQYSNMQSGMSQQYSNYAANPQTMMQGNMQGNQQMMQGAQGNMFAGQQQGFGQARPAQPDYRQMGQNPRAPYMQQAPNVTMNTNMNTMGAMGGQGGPAPPYSRTAAQTMQPNVQNQNQFQQQQRMRQQMLAMQQQQQQQQQQGGPQGNQPSPALVAHLQRQQMNPNPYHQPPPYNMQ
ncbi:mediator of RNA polymerase II transcription subunit 12-like, partial [Anoplophora glabripennis]